MCPCVRIYKSFGVKTSTEFYVQYKPEVIWALKIYFSQFKIKGVNVV